MAHTRGHRLRLSRRMRFLLDMNLSPAMADWLRREGHDAVHARDIGLNTLPDRDLFARAVADDRILITFDLDHARRICVRGCKQRSR